MSWRERFRKTKSTSQQPTTPELNLEPVIFSPESRRLLEEQGYTIVTLSGQSVKSLRESGRPFFSTWHEGNKSRPDIEELRSMQSEVAINPDPEKIFLPREKQPKGIPEHELHMDFAIDATEELSKTISTEIPGVKAVIGNVADYVEFAFRYLDSNGEKIFGRIYYNREGVGFTTYVRTIDSPIKNFYGHFHSSTVGFWNNGMDIWNGDRFRVGGVPKTDYCPLIVPKDALEPVYTPYLREHKLRLEEIRKRKVKPK